MPKNTNAMKKELKKESEKRTRRINNYDHNVLLPILMKGLEMKKGKMNAVTNKQIVYGLRSQGLKIRDTDVRMLINHIRTNDLIVGLMATSAGYYITNNEQDFMDYEQSLLGREKEIRKVRMSIQRQRRTMFSQFSPRQTQLF